MGKFAKAFSRKQDSSTRPGCQSLYSFLRVKKIKVLLMNVFDKAVKII